MAEELWNFDKPIETLKDVRLARCQILKSMHVQNVGSAVDLSPFIAINQVLDGVRHDIVTENERNRRLAPSGGDT